MMIMRLIHSQLKPAPRQTVPGRLIAVGGVGAICVSVGLLASLVVRADVSLNWLNMFTVAGAAGAGFAFLYGARTRTLVLANAALVLAVLPAMFGWVWLLYVPPSICAAVGTMWKAFRRNPLN